MKLESSIVGSALKEGVEGVDSENAAINETRKWMSGTKIKPLYARVPRILAPALLVIGIGIAAYAQESSDKPIISLSTVSKLDRSQAGIYRTKIGKIDVIAVSDGTVGLGLTKELVRNAKPGEVERLLARHLQKSPLDASVNAFLIQYENKLVLIDAGSSELVGPTAGKLPQSLRAAGVPPENITDVFVTHIHPDHTGGLMNGNTKVFPNATIHVNKREVDYWFNKSITATAVEPQKTFFAQVDPKVKPYMDSGQLKTFEGATEFFPGFRAEPAYGHTAGLTVYVLENGGEKVMFWGDVVNIAPAGGRSGHLSSLRFRRCGRGRDAEKAS